MDEVATYAKDSCRRLNFPALGLVQGFSCGNDFIDNYLRTHFCALWDHTNGLTSTTVILFQNEIVAFYSANCTQVHIPSNEARMLGIASGRLSVPAIEVKYLAVSQEHQGRGIGKIIIETVIADVYQLSRRFACRYIFLWSVPIEQAISFYTRRFFKDTGETNTSGLRLMKFQIPPDIGEEEY
jgi:GNAT superfamily N-acetyltransferase